LLFFGHRHYCFRWLFFGDILVAQRNAIAGDGFEVALIKARRWALDAAPIDAASRQEGCQVSRRGRSANRFAPG
jgi:hypothetical protein